jgi:hypothetical protein
MAHYDEILVYKGRTPRLQIRNPPQGKSAALDGCTGGDRVVAEASETAEWLQRQQR